MGATGASTVLYAETTKKCVLLATLWVLAQSDFSTMPHAETTKKCVLLATLWVLAPTTHGKKTQKYYITFSLYLSLFNL